MTRKPHGAKLVKSEMKKVDLLAEVLQRLINDVGTVLDLIDKRNEGAEHQIGFWASIRMIMPVVEATSRVVGKTPQQFLGEHLGIATPYLTWDLFRHSLAHGDYPQTGEYQGKRAAWGIAFAAGHSFGDGKIHISVRSLYEDLKKYLEVEIGKQDDSLVQVNVGVVYCNPHQTIVDDFAKL